MKLYVQLIVVANVILLNSINSNGETDVFGIVFREVKDEIRKERYNRLALTYAKAKLAEIPTSDMGEHFSGSNLKVVSTHIGYCGMMVLVKVIFEGSKKDPKVFNPFVYFHGKLKPIFSIFYAYRVFFWRF